MWCRMNFTEKQEKHEYENGFDLLLDLEEFFEESLKRLKVIRNKNKQLPAKVDGVLGGANRK